MLYSSLSFHQSVLPPGVKYLIDSCDDSEHGLEALMHVNLQTEEQALGSNAMKICLLLLYDLT